MTPRTLLFLVIRVPCNSMIILGSAFTFLEKIKAIGTELNLQITLESIWSHHFMGNRRGNSGNSVRLFLGGAPKSLQMVTAAMKLNDAYSLEEKL